MKIRGARTKVSKKAILARMRETGIVVREVQRLATEALLDGKVVACCHEGLEAHASPFRPNQTLGEVVNFFESMLDPSNPLKP